MEHEITVKGPLLNEKGALREPGWARFPLLSYERSAVKASPFRIKEWDYYCIVSGDRVFAFTVADNGYMGLLSITAIDLNDKTEITESPMFWFPMGKTNLPSDSTSGVTEAHTKGTSLRFETKGGVRTLSVSCDHFGSASKGKTSSIYGDPSIDSSGGVSFSAEIELAEPSPCDSIVIATPFDESPKAFYYNRKINCQRASGNVSIGTNRYPIDPSRSYGVLDWGRGVWPYSNVWLWGSASGTARIDSKGEPHLFGFNIGYGFGNTSAASENAVFIDGVMHKVGKITISLDDSDFLKPWKVLSEDSRLSLTLSPIIDRASSTDFGILASIQHQVFGKWSGYFELDDGRRVIVEDLTGFCEKVKNRW